jgi:putative ABC transport system permease protein
VHPIVAALKHHKTAVALVALEIALTCTIVTNALFIIGDRVAGMRVNTGVADDELVWATSSGLRDGETPESAAGRAAADMAALRAMPGVKAVARVNTLPLASRNSWGTCLQLKPGDDKKSALCTVRIYAGAPGALETLGVRLVRGRGFLPQEYRAWSLFDDKPPPAAVIVSRDLAERAWPGEDPIGKPLYFGDHGKYASHVAGVIGHLLNPDLDAHGQSGQNVFLPVTAIPGGMYVLRVAPAMRDAVSRDLPAVLDRVDDQRIVTTNQVYAQTVADYFHDDRALIWLLLAVVGCLLAVSALGVAGLSSFWVQQRARQIGIRRAIGATRGDILRYFQAENFLIVTVGIAVGSVGAVGLNFWLMKRYELAHMPLAWLGGGALVLWALGQLAALGPALRAASVPPVVATRAL